MTEILTDYSLVELLMNDEFSAIILGVAICVIIPLLAKLAFHIISICFHFLAMIATLIAYIWNSNKDSVIAWYKEDFLPVFGPKKK